MGTSTVRQRKQDLDGRIFGRGFVRSFSRLLCYFYVIILIMIQIYIVFMYYYDRLNYFYRHVTCAHGRQLESWVLVKERLTDERFGLKSEI